MTCQSCVQSNPRCSYCTDSRTCANQCSRTNVSAPQVWQCALPQVLGCEALLDCTSCVGAGGCVWIPHAVVNGVAVGPLCYTGGLFALANAQGPGWTLSAADGWFYEQCNMTSLSIIILSASCLGAVLLIVAVTVAVCVYTRRRKQRHMTGEFASLRANPDTEPLVYGSPDTSATAPPAKKKKKKRGGSGIAEATLVVRDDGAQINSSRYYQSRERTARHGY